MPSYASVLADIFDRRAEKRLSQDEERELLLAAQGGDEEAVFTLMYAYAPALRSAVAQYRNAGGVHADGHMMEELQSLVVLGFLEALKAFDPELHRRLAAIIGGYLADSLSAGLTSPIAFTVPPRTLKRFYSILRKADGNPYDAAALAPKYEMKTETFLAVLTAVRSASLDLPTGAEDEDTFPASWEAARPVWMEAVDAEDAVLVEVAFEAVDELEGDVCRLSYGFTDYDPVPDAEIGDRLGFSRAKAQRIRSGALGKMRQALGVA